MTLLRPFQYHDEATELDGVLAWTESAEGPRPGLLLVHGGAGLDDHARGQAARYAELGYTVLAADMFGPGIAGNRERVVATLMELRDNPGLIVRRATAGMSALAQCPEASGCRAAVGFCFGGMVVLALARAGVDIAGVISMHGSLATSAPAQPGAVRSRILVCHGSADPHVPMADVTAFVDEMGAAAADHQVLILGGALHGFTHRDAVAGATPGVAYDEAADRRSFDAARLFLAELAT
ncbi:MAG: hypothetical protein QOK05_607 [Chloroflexota bacterium]|jgi:dienelactone hydrolase|nr:hypothetical protein [Chloroflexota bacterium]